MMTSSNGHIFRVTGPLCGEFTGPGEFPTQRPVTRSFGVFFDLRLNKRLSKQPWGWWFETLSLSLWRHRNAVIDWGSGDDIFHWRSTGICCHLILLLLLLLFSCPCVLNVSLPDCYRVHDFSVQWILLQLYGIEYNCLGMPQTHNQPDRIYFLWAYAMDVMTYNK